MKPTGAFDRVVAAAMPLLGCELSNAGTAKCIVDRETREPRDSRYESGEQKLRVSGTSQKAPCYVNEVPDCWGPTYIQERSARLYRYTAGDV